MEKKAIAYTSDIILGNTGEVIEREFQKKRIEEYAKENHITIAAWFEEEAYNDTLFARPKIRELVAYKEPYDLVLVERTWALSRRWTEIKAFIKVLEANNGRMECATTLWDCVSQMARNYYRPAGKRVEMAACALEAQEAAAPASINLVGRTGGPRRSQTTVMSTW